ncbi:MAG TPA: hypothetical protein VHO24_13545 [Opitutaceae bacterium]|nr:hypothetical protein [Opitutaceae bacterium]
MVVEKKIPGDFNEHAGEAPAIKQLKNFFPALGKSCADHSLQKKTK